MGMTEALCRCAQESIGKFPRPTQKAASIRAALTRVILTQLRHGHPNGDSDILQTSMICPNWDGFLDGLRTYVDRPCSCIADGNCRCHRQTVAVDVLLHVPPRVDRLS